MEGTPEHTSPLRRVASIDILRGLTILLMIFVNDIAGVAGTPSWLKHFEPFDGNGMTVVDVVFPAFLFIVGLSIPLALRNRERKGESTVSTARHILSRTLSLLIIGVLMVNSDSISSQGIINPSLWTLLMYTGVFLVWVNWPAETEKQEKTQRVLRLVGLLLILTTSMLYRTDEVTGWFQIRPGWWGILGLIGWAYLVAGLIHLLARSNRFVVLAGAAGLFAFYIALESGELSQLERATPFIHLSYTLGSHAALVLLGAFMGWIFLPESSVRKHGQRAAWGILYAAGLALAGWLLYLPHKALDFFIINKNLGTPPWCLLSAAATAAALIVVYWLVDRKPRSGRAGIAKLAGRNALFAYILAPFLYALFSFVADLTGTTNLLVVLATPFAVGLGRAIALSLLVMGLAAWLSRRRINLKI
jgi:predicted acyltransferase